MAKSNGRPQNGKSCKTDNSKQNGKGFKPPFRGKQFGSGNKEDRRDEEIADTAFAARKNDVKWYTKYTQFAEDASKLPFATPVGNLMPQEFHGSSATTPFSFKYAAPGIMRIVFSPSIGVSKDYTSPLNRSSINFYARLRSTQKAFGDYDHQDLTMMILAVDSLIMFHSLARRIYGLLTDMTPTNRFYPRALIAASGVQFTDVQKTIQDFRAWINEFGLLIEQYALPDNIELFKRHSWMCEGLYTDAQGAKAQTYMFVPRGFWKFDGKTATGSALAFVPYVLPGDTTPTSYTIDQFEAIGNELINAISNNADFATIAGDLYAYYGGQIMHLPYVEEKYQILPSYNTTVLSQIENAVLCGDWASDYTPTITQSNEVGEGAILFQPIVQQNMDIFPMSLKMNMHIDSPTPNDVMEATRLMVAFSDTDLETGHRAIEICASEICHFADIFAVNPATNGIRSRRVDGIMMVIETENVTDAVLSNWFGDVLYTINFDWAPRLEVYVRDVKTQYGSYCGSTWDNDNATQLLKWQLDSIHAAALYSLFNVETR